MILPLTRTGRELCHLLSALSSNRDHRPQNATTQTLCAWAPKPKNSSTDLVGKFLSRKLRLFYAGFVRKSWRKEKIHPCSLIPQIASFYHSQTWEWNLWALKVYLFRFSSLKSILNAIVDYHLNWSNLRFHCHFNAKLDFSDLDYEQLCPK